LDKISSVKVPGINEPKNKIVDTAIIVFCSLFFMDVFMAIFFKLYLLDVEKKYIPQKLLLFF